MAPPAASQPAAQRRIEAKLDEVAKALEEVRTNQAVAATQMAARDAAAAAERSARDERDRQIAKWQEETFDRLAASIVAEKADREKSLGELKATLSKIAFAVFGAGLTIITSGAAYALYATR